MRIWILCFALAMGFSPAIALGQNEARAQQTFGQAQQLAASGRFGEALELYRESNRLAPGNAAPLLGIGVCLSELGPRHFEEALEMLDRYLDIGRNSQSRQQAEQIIRTLVGHLGYSTLHLSVTPPTATVSVEGDEVPAHRLDRVRVRAGTVTVTARASGYERARHQVSVVAGSEHAFNIALQSRSSQTPTPQLDVGSAYQPAAATPQRRPVYKRWWFWTIIGTVVAGGAVGLAVGLTREDDNNSWELP